MLVHMNFLVLSQFSAHSPPLHCNVPILIILFLAGETFFLGMLVYKTYVENFPDGTATNSNVTTVAKPTYEQILPDYLQVFPEEWNMKDFLYYWVVGLGLSILLYQVKPCDCSRSLGTFLIRQPTETSHLTS